MAILVTGSEGFIGRHLVKRLEADGHEIMKFDPVVDTYRDILVGRPSIRWSDITKIYHLGAISSTSEDDWPKINKHNTDFSLRTLGLANMRGVDVVYASSGAVYGHTATTTYQYNPLNYYATSKMIVDMWVEKNLPMFTKRMVGLRFFNVYGDDEDKPDLNTSPIYRFRKQAKETGIIKVMEGSHETSRDFVCVEDVINILLKAMDTQNGIYDVGTGKSVNFMDIAKKVADKYNADIQLIPMPDNIKGIYQKDSIARKHWNYDFKSIEQWLFERD